MKCSNCKTDALLTAASASGKYLTYTFTCPKCGRTFKRKEKDYESRG